MAVKEFEIKSMYFLYYSQYILSPVLHLLKKWIVYDNKGKFKDYILFS